MHRIFHLPVLFGIILLCACKSSRVHPSGTFTGKLLSVVCAQYMVQLVSGDMDPAHYLKSWEHPYSHKVYHNVFSLKNPCYFDSTGVKIGDTFQFDVLPDSTDRTCVVCFVYEPTPPVRNTIRVVSSAK